MAIDVVDLRSFYASPLGIVARRLLARAINGLWPDASGLRVLGIGYATPYLLGLSQSAERVAALMPARQGVVNWPAGARSASALVDETMLPLPDAAYDRVLLVHALETTDNPAEVLAEVWRILTPGGRMVTVTPNRRGPWARMDNNPFGHGRPYSRGQLRNLMREALFTPETWTEALYVPPLRGRLFLRSATAWERVGAALSLPFAGVHVVDATKQVYRPVPVRVPQRRLATQLRPALLPSPSATRVASR